MSVLNSDDQDIIVDFISAKRDSFEAYKAIKYFWLAGHDQGGEWAWIGQEQAFTSYTNWEANKPGWIIFKWSLIFIIQFFIGIGCPEDAEGNVICDGKRGLILQFEEPGQTWRAADETDPTEVGYVCMSGCRQGFEYFPEVRQCLKVVTEPS